MLDLIRGEFSGIRAAEHQADLVQRLDYVLSWLGPGNSRRQQYEEIRTVLLEMDEEVMSTLTGMSQSCCPFQSLNTFMCRMLLCLHVCTSPPIPLVVCRLPGTPSLNLSVVSILSVLLFDDYSEVL